MNALDTVAFSDEPWPGDWARKGRCRTAPTVVFFPGRGDLDGEAKKICQLCPVLAECRAYALAIPRLHGVWGGLNAEDRHRLRNAPPQPAAAAVARTRAAEGTLDRYLEKLVDHPGQWARVAVYPSKHSAAAVASMLRTGRRPHPPGAWEFEGRLTDSGGSALYAQYLGTKEHACA